MERRPNALVQPGGVGIAKDLQPRPCFDMMTMNANLALRIRHAEAYPFARPACSYLFADGRMQPLSDRAVDGRVPVVASGSNASPERLRAKFGIDEVIPVTRATLRDFAVVFAGHFTAYGAMPATLCPSIGACTEVWITWLTPLQHIVMHRSEGVIDRREVEQRYEYVDLVGLDLRLERGARVERAGAYLSRRMLAPAGEPIRFAEVLSSGAGFEARSERSMLRVAAALLDPETAFADFMARVLSGVGQRQALFQALSPFTVERTASLMAGGMVVSEPQLSAT